MTIHPLDGARSRFDWGRESLKILKGDIQAFTDGFARTKTFAVTHRGYVEPDGKHWMQVVDRAAAVPPHITLRAAEIVQHFRSALDYLAYELSFVDAGGVEVTRFRTTAGKRQNTNIAFPLITRSAGSWLECGRRFDAECPRYLPGVTVRHRAMIKRRQPYHRWNHPHYPGWHSLPWPHPLETLANLDNDNKHRLVQPGFGAPASLEIGGNYLIRDCELLSGIVEYFDLTARPLEPGTKMCRLPIRVTGPNPYVRVPAKMDYYVSFRNGNGVWGSLDEIGKEVASILAEFKPVFETQKARRVWKPRSGRIEPPVNPPKRQIIPMTFG